MPRLFANNAISTLATALAPSDTALVLATGEGARFPSPVSDAGDDFVVTVGDTTPGEANEIMRVTARTGDTLTVERASEGTTALAFDVGASVGLFLTAAQFAALWSDVGVLKSTATGDQPTTTRIVSGGAVAWESGYTFRIGAATYEINGVQYASAEQTVTLDAADATLDRTDVIALDDTGTAVAITGTPAALPFKPDVDPFTQLERTFVPVAHGTTSAPVTETVVYDEGTGEWTGSSGGSGWTFNSTTQAASGTKSIRASAVATNGQVTFTAPVALDLSGASQLAFRVFVTVAWAATRGFQLAFRNAAGTRLGNAVTLANGAYGFNATRLNTWQLVVIPLPAFALPTGTTEASVRGTVVGSGTGLSFYLDRVVVQGNVSVPSPATTAPVASATQTGTVKTVTTQSDPVVPTAADVARGDVSVTTGSLADDAGADVTLALGKASDVLAIATSVAAWVRLYDTAASRTADAARTIDEAVVAGNGCSLDVVTEAGALTQFLDPVAHAVNRDTPVSATIYGRVVNASGGTAVITVTATRRVVEF